MDWKFEKICIQYLTQGWECTWDNNSRNPGGLGWKKI